MDAKNAYEHIEEPIKDYGEKVDLTAKLLAEGAWADIVNAIKTEVRLAYLKGRKDGLEEIIKEE